jgi:hypothetical protein
MSSCLPVGQNQEVRIYTQNAIHETSYGKPHEVGESPVAQVQSGKGVQRGHNDMVIPRNMVEQEVF